jgi:hypothetical protein
MDPSKGAELTQGKVPFITTSPWVEEALEMVLSFVDDSEIVLDVGGIFFAASARIAWLEDDKKYP